MFKHNDPDIRPELIDQNQPDYASQISSAFGLTRRAPGFLDNHIQTTLTVDDLTAPEFQYLRRRQLWTARCSRAANVANKGYAVLPGAPGTLTVVNRISIYNTGAVEQGYYVGIAALNLNVVAAEVGPADQRLVGQRPASFPYVGDALAPIIPLGKIVLVPAKGTIEITQPYVLSGSTATGLTVLTTNVNVQLDAQLEYTERRILETELR